jgi:ABC-type polysaccharide/polyol phosphate transport system ATPase subunit
MPYSSLRKTRWSFDSDRPAPAGPETSAGRGLIELNDVSLRFVNYADKQYSLKRAVLDLVLRRESPAPASEFWALSAISLTIGHGERVGLVGGNGAGKSTLLRLLARIYPATSGQVSIRGSVAPLIEMGAGFNPELSGRDNIILNGAMLGFSRARMLGMIDKIHEFTGLSEFAEMPLKYYSSGMYMRLAFAIATEVDPDILLIDESLGVGDAAFQEKAKARIRGLFERTKVVILVSHDMEALRQLCTRGIWIEQGRLLADGPIDEIIARYLEAVAARAAAAASA